MALGRSRGEQTLFHATFSVLRCSSHAGLLCTSAVPNSVLKLSSFFLECSFPRPWHSCLPHSKYPLVPEPLWPPRWRSTPPQAGLSPFSSFTVFTALVATWWLLFWMSVSMLIVCSLKYWASLPCFPVILHCLDQSPAYFGLQLILAGEWMDKWINGWMNEWMNYGLEGVTP